MNVTELIAHLQSLNRPFAEVVSASDYEGKRFTRVFSAGCDYHLPQETFAAGMEYPGLEDSDGLKPLEPGNVDIVVIWPVDLRR